VTDIILGELDQQVLDPGAAGDQHHLGIFTLLEADHEVSNEKIPWLVGLYRG